MIQFSKYDITKSWGESQVKAKWSFKSHFKEIAPPTMDYKIR